MYLSIRGDRRSGKTTALANHMADFLKLNEKATVALLTPTKIHQQIVLSALKEKLPMEAVKRVYLFTTVGARITGFHFDALYVDEAGSVPSDLLYAAQKATLGPKVLTWDSLS